MSETTIPSLEVHGLVKSYGDVQALKDMDFSVAKGEVRALMGANGAGKSTLVKCLGGVEEPTAGKMLFNGEVYSPSNPSDAQNAGIAIVHQELSLVPGLTVAENITMGRWPARTYGPLNVLNKHELQSEAQRVLEMLGEHLPLGAEVGLLSPAKQQLVEIGKALSKNLEVLILDEPTSSLAAHEVENLISLVRRLATHEVAVIYVSHRMEEIPRVADSVTVLRDGLEVATHNIDEMDTATIASLMLGEDLAARSEAPEKDFGDVLLSVRGLTIPHVIDDVTFDVRSGEIVGITGLMGSGRTEILRAIFGLDHATGTVEVHGQEIKKRSPRSMTAAGVGMTPEDRKGQGLVLGLPVRENLIMTCYDKVRGLFGILSNRSERTMARDSIISQSIDTSSSAQLVGQLSGGNQQKVVIGKWLNRGVDVLLMDEPTRGVDVHAKNQTYDTITKLANDGCAIVFVSSEAEEIFFVCQRVLIVHGGRIVAERQVHQTDAREVLTLSMEEETVA